MPWLTPVVNHDGVLSRRKMFRRLNVFRKGVDGLEYGGGRPKNLCLYADGCYLLESPTSSQCVGVGLVEWVGILFPYLVLVKLKPHSCADITCPHLT